MAYCSSCKRHFISQEAMREHLENSSAHKRISLPTPWQYPQAVWQPYYPAQYPQAVWQPYCFSAESSSYRSSDRSIMPYCSSCSRHFVSEEAKQQHLDNSPAHFRAAYKCSSCNRDFADHQAWKNHMTFSSKHNYCFDCERDFSTADGLSQHREHAAVHRGDIWGTANDSDSSSIDIDSDARSDADSDDHNEADSDAPSEVDSEAPSAMYWNEADSDTRNDANSENSEPNSWRHLEEILSRISLRSPTLPERPSDTFESAPPTQFTALEKAVTADLEDSKAEDEKEEAKGSILCPVCFESKSSVSATECGHVFCTTCIYRAFDQKYECPVCRKPAFPDELRRLYLGI